MTSKPDLSNVLKTLEDRLVNLQFLEDDARIVGMHLAKFWGNSPGLSITILQHGLYRRVVGELLVEARERALTYGREALSREKLSREPELEPEP